VSTEDPEFGDSEPDDAIDADDDTAETEPEGEADEVL
jgi:hypothetical protein